MRYVIADLYGIKGCEGFGLVRVQELIYYVSKMPQQTTGDAIISALHLVYKEEPGFRNIHALNIVGFLDMLYLWCKCLSAV